MKALGSILSILILSSFVSFAQKNDSLPVRKNTIKINLISSFVYANSGALSYERVRRPNQTWGVMLGYVQFPRLGSFGSSITSSEVRKNTGYVVGGEYRFYLKKENKYLAPHGVYIGPYANYFSFSNERSLTYTDSNGSSTTASLNTDINVLNIGVGLGYQFVINDRWTFDFVFVGPSISRYGMNLSLTGFNATEEDLVGHEILQALTDKFPIVKDLLLDQNVNVHGSTSTWAPGFRYQMNVGYRFGGKK